MPISPGHLDMRGCLRRAVSFRLLDKGWADELNAALQADHSTVRVVCPFIKRGAAELLLARGVPDTLQVITRFDLGQMSEGVSDTEALRLLLENGAQIRGVKRLHTKMYVLGAGSVIVTSANLTQAALYRNHEFGFLSDDHSIVGECREYFERLWERAGDDLTEERLDGWEEEIATYQASGARPARSTSLGDEGVDVDLGPGPGTPEPISVPPWVDEAEQAFVKFFGKANNRESRSQTVLYEVERSGCHWACTYPKGGRPRQVKDGAVMFMARLVARPNDIMIFGRGVGMEHVEGRDEASPDEIAARDWKVDWPHYIRVHHTEFLASELGNGVSLYELMDELGANAFATTQANARRGSGNTDPKYAYRSRPSVELTLQGLAWVNDRLERAFEEHGQIAPEALDELDWPEGLDRDVAPVRAPAAV